MGRGRFLVFEGTEGSGKSTQIRLLAARLESKGQRVVVTREPGGTAVGESIRDLLLSDAAGEADPRTIALLHTAARAEHVAKVIKPSLHSGLHVLSDRFYDSTLAYQGGGGGLPVGELLALQAFAIDDCEPDIRILLRVDVEAGIARRMNHPQQVNWIDRADVDFHRRVQAVFEERASLDPAQWLMIDANASIDAVAEAIVTSLRVRFPELGL